MRKSFLVLWLCFLIAVIVSLFWHNEWKYSLPTPVPANYKTVQTGQVIALQANIGSPGKKPLFLHFFNPACPCSRFNMPHVQSLVKEYGKQVDFAIVVMSPEKYSVAEIQKKFQLNVPVFFDSAIAASCGVYSTPQAVILNSGRELYYRGNYNKTRYCTDKKSNYAQMALDGLLNDHSLPFSEAAAFKAYGCQLPTCNK